MKASVARRLLLYALVKGLSDAVRYNDKSVGDRYRRRLRLIAKEFEANPLVRDTLGVPSSNITRGVPCDEPPIPFARKRTSLLARQRDAVALAFGTNSVDASSDLSVPFPKLLLRCARSQAGTSGELGFVTRAMPPPVLIPDIIGKPFSREEVTVFVLL
jgi:hypothetical protein